MGRLRAGVIGLGVGEKHAEALAANADCELVALCDHDAEKLAQVASRFPGARPVVRDVEILDDPTIDLICIASYDDVHFTQTMRALEHGKHVFVEKPFVMREDEARTVREVLRQRSGLRLSSNLILRMSPRFRDLRRRLDAGELGTLFSLEADYRYGRLHKLTEGWRGKLDFYSVVHGGGVHVVDLLMWLTQDRIVEVYAMGSSIASAGAGFGNFDMVIAVVRFQSGAIGKVGVDYGCVLPHFHQVSIFGTKGSFINGQGTAHQYLSRDPAVAPLKLNTPYPGVHKGALIPSFIDAILGRGHSEVDEDDVFRSMSVCFAIERSAHAGVPVTVEYI